MRTIKLVLEYDGTDFVGWQRQPNGISVQEVVEQALEQVLGAPAQLLSAGRTDAGVHARGMVAHFTTDGTQPLRAFRDGVNRYLPATVAVRDAMEKRPGFHARFDARGKWYRYSLYRSPVRSPLHARTAWHLRGRLDLAAMRAAARVLVGRHDFAAFRAAGCAARSTVRELFDITLTENGELLCIDVRGSGFLRHMVRTLAGTLVEVGQGRRSVSEVRDLLLGGERCAAGVTAPAHGLCLMEVWY